MGPVTDFISTRELAQVLAAVLAKVGPVALTEGEIAAAPALRVEVPAEGTCLVSVGPRGAEG